MKVYLTYNQLLNRVNREADHRKSFSSNLHSNSRLKYVQAQVYGFNISFWWSNSSKRKTALKTQSRRIPHKLRPVTKAPIEIKMATRLLVGIPSRFTFPVRHLANVLTSNLSQLNKAHSLWSSNLKLQRWTSQVVLRALKTKISITWHARNLSLDWNSMKSYMENHKKFTTIETASFNKWRSRIKVKLKVRMG